jgi:hypothetical protein
MHLSDGAAASRFVRGAKTHFYPEAEQAHKDLDVALAAAKLDNKRVLVIFGANWC